MRKLGLGFMAALVRYAVRNNLVQARNTTTPHRRPSSMDDLREFWLTSYLAPRPSLARTGVTAPPPRLKCSSPRISSAQHVERHARDVLHAHARVGRDDMDAFGEPQPRTLNGVP